VLVLDEAKRKNVRLEGKANYFDKTGKQMKETGTNVNEIMHEKRKREVLQVEEFKEKDKIFDLEKIRGIQFSRKLKMKRRRL
jgi:hypothetical protein